MASLNSESAHVSVELQPRLEDSLVLVGGDEEQGPIGTATSSLSPCDGGAAAWRMLATGFVFECLLWGFPLSFGVFQNYYTQLPQFADNPFISVIGTSASGLCYIGAPVMIPITKRYSRYRRHIIYLGWPLCIIGLLASSFANTLGALVFTQGIMYGAGFVIFYYPILSFLNEYWLARKGLAYGIMCSASGVSGAVMPFVLEILLNKHGHRTTLRAVAIGLVITTGPLIPLLRPRSPESGVHSTTKTEWTFLRSGLFWTYSASNIAQGFGYFIPALYLPSYATSLGYSSSHGALLLAIMSISQVFGQLSFGYLSDHRVPVNLLIVSSTLVSTLAILVCWGLAHTFGLLVLFALLYGYFGAGYVAMWARMGTAVSSDPTTAFAAFGLFNLGKGMGNVLAGPIGGLLVRNAVESQSYAVSRFEGPVLFAGCCMLASTITISLCYVQSLNGLLKSLSLPSAFGHQEYPLTE